MQTLRAKVSEFYDQLKEEVKDGIEFNRECVQDLGSLMKTAWSESNEYRKERLDMLKELGKGMQIKYLIGYGILAVGGCVVIAGLTGCGDSPELPKPEIRSAWGDEVGQTAKLILDGNFSDCWRQWGKKAVLYDNGKVIQVWENSGGFDIAYPQNIGPENSGYHEHTLKIFHKEGTVESDPILIHYSGSIDDRVPSVKISCEVIGDSIRLGLQAVDEGDNALIKRAVLYENGKSIKEWGDFMGVDIVDITKTKKGTHKYEFEVTDKGGHTVRSEPITVQFNSWKQ